MRFLFLLRLLTCCLGLTAVFSVVAQTTIAPSDELAAIQAERTLIQIEKKRIIDEFENASKACWKQFAVNDCLANVRRQKYQNLAPLEQQEIQLNGRQRELKQLERQQRLSDKTSSKGAP